MSLWPFVPQAEMSEKQEWKTEVLEAYSSEQRLSLRPIPRTYLTMSFQLVDTQLEHAYELALLHTTDEIDCPLWIDYLRVNGLKTSDTSIAVDTQSGRFVVGQKALVLGDDNTYEEVTLDSNTGSSLGFSTTPLTKGYDYAIIVPIFPSIMVKSPTFTKGNHQTTVCKAVFAFDADFGIAENNTFPVFDGTYIMSDRAVASSVSNEVSQKSKVFPNISGKIVKQTRSNLIRTTDKLQWSFDNYLDSYPTRQWIHSTRGRQKSFYLPKWTNDFIPTRDIVNTETFIYVKRNLNLENSFSGPILVVLNDGTLHPFIVTSLVLFNATELRLEVGTTGIDVMLSDIELICRMPKNRLSQDVINFRRTNSGGFELGLKTIEVTA
jgi:hypothetical protein